MQMKVIVPCTWRQAMSQKFNVDKVLKEPNKLKASRLQGLVDKYQDIAELKQWLDQQSITHYTLNQLYRTWPKARIAQYEGLMFQFTQDSDFLLFKLTWN
jgi:hypothetical protein